MTPESNNVYGQIEAPNGLEPIRFALAKWLSHSAVSIYQSSYDGSETMRLRTAGAEFESVPLENGCHLFNGCVEGSLTTIELFIANLSRQLESIGIDHSFEIDDDI